MTPEEIVRLAGEGESETLEFKRSTGQRREAMKTICAFLNHAGGRVLFGVEPDGRIRGQLVSDQTMERVVQELRLIEPSVFPDLRRIDIHDGRQIVAIEVPPGSHQP